MKYRAKKKALDELGIPAKQLAKQIYLDLEDEFSLRPYDIEQLTGIIYRVQSRF